MRPTIPSLLFIISALQWLVEGRSILDELLVKRDADLLSQSPIDIITQQAIVDTQNLKPLQYFNYYNQINWTAFNNNETVKFTTNGVKNQNQPFFIIPATSSTPNMPYFFDSFHFHWGNESSEGSEHLINSKHFPLEVHLVHFSPFNKISVLGFLFEISADDNPALNPIIEALSEITSPSASTTANFSLADSLLYLNQHLSKFYRYNGSLTTEPYTEGVLWHVFEAKIPISEKQIEAFRATEIEENWREQQPLNGRKVYYSHASSKFSFNDQSVIYLILIVAHFIAKLI